MDFDIAYLSVLQNMVQNSNLFELFLKLVLIYFAILWISLIVWVTRDVITRSNSVIFQAISILLNTFFPVFGLIIYLLLRPNKTLLDNYYEEVELKALSKDFYCPSCSSVCKIDSEYCMSCGDSLLSECGACKKKSFKQAEFCPYCGVQEKKKPTKKTKK